jgi:hypothetical protein
MILIDAIFGLAKSGVDGVREHYEGKRKIRQAVVENKVRMASSAQTHNQNWEMRQLDNVGAKDDILFYAFIVLFIWTGFFPEASQEFYKNIEKMPELFVKVFLWLIASVVGVKKIGDYAPAAIGGIKAALSKPVASELTDDLITKVADKLKAQGR